MCKAIRPCLQNFNGLAFAKAMLGFPPGNAQGEAMKYVTELSIVALAALALLAGDAQAQARRAVPKNATSVVVTNMRQAALQELDLATTGDQPVIAARLAKPLAPGKSITLTIKGKRGCTFDVRGMFDDNMPAEADAVDFCLDNKLRLTE